MHPSKPNLAWNKSLVSLTAKADSGHFAEWSAFKLVRLSRATNFQLDHTDYHSKPNSPDCYLEVKLFSNTTVFSQSSVLECCLPALVVETSASTQEICLCLLVFELQNWLFFLGFWVYMEFQTIVLTTCRVLARAIMRSTSFCRQYQTRHMSYLAQSLRTVRHPKMRYWGLYQWSVTLILVWFDRHYVEF